MLTRKIPSTGENLPVIGCGTWRGFDVGRGAEVSTRLTAGLRALLPCGLVGQQGQACLAHGSRVGGRHQ